MKEYLAEKTEEKTQHNSNVNKLIKKLSDGGFDPIVIKGPVLAELYPDPALPESVDIDIFLENEAKCNAATEYLLSAGGKPLRGL